MFSSWPLLSSFPLALPGAEEDPAAPTRLRHVVAAFWGPNVKPAFTQTSSTVFQHESMLRTVMEALQLPDPPGAAATAPGMAEFFVQKSVP